MFNKSLFAVSSGATARGFWHSVRNTFASTTGRLQLVLENFIQTFHYKKALKVTVTDLFVFQMKTCNTLLT
jgi:hypothetical protein